ncbi:MAG: hypothetical protein KC621_26965 [Myxococcales bacterium]|nr:hypothetical protein [Myxococcales bacterium]
MTRDERRSLVLIVLALGALAVVLWRTAWVSDDAFITLRTVENLIGGRGLTWNPGERVQVFTHPLWMWVMVPLHALTGSSWVTLLLPSFACDLLAVGLLLGSARTRPAAVAGTAGVLLGSKAFVDFGTSGLEQPLLSLLLVLFLMEGWSARRPLLLGALAGLVAFTRLDATLLVAPTLVLALRGTSRRERLGAVGLAALPAGAWMAFSLLYFGFALPNTAVAKLGHGLPVGDVLIQGLAYVRNASWFDPVLLPTLLGATALGGRRPEHRGPLLGLWASVGYVVWVGGDFMAGRFLVPAFVVAAAVLSRTLEGRWAWGLAPAALGLALLAPHPSLTSGPSHGDGRRIWGDLVDLNGIADERAWWYGCAGWRSDRREPGEPDCSRKRQVERLLDAHETVVVAGGVGFLGREAGDDLIVVDDRGLTDPLVARMPSWVGDRGQWRPGHVPRILPKGYVETVRSGEDHFEDRDAAELFERLRLVTSGPVLAPERLTTIGGFLVGSYDGLVPEGRRSRPGPKRLEAQPQGAAPGTACNETHMTFYRIGFRLVADEPRHDRWLRLVIDDDADVTVDLGLDGQLVDSVSTPGDDASPGVIRARCLPVPERAATQGYDELHVRPTRGDKSCFVSLHPVETCEG